MRAVHKEQRRLSLASLDKWIKDLEIRQKKYPQIALKIADRLAEEMMKDVYPDTQKVSAKSEGNVATAGI